MNPEQAAPILFAFVGGDKPAPKGLSHIEIIGLQTVFTPSTLFPAGRMWEGAKRVYGDVANMPEELLLIIWGQKVVNARRVEKCPECGWAGDVFTLCPYHFDRQCPSCHGINGMVAGCTCP